jgi:Domain of unknown function (DUF4279)
MSNADEPKMFRTLRGFLNGEEPDEANYFRFSARLRIHGDNVPFEEISERLGIQPTHLHRKGERRGPIFFSSTGSAAFGPPRKINGAWRQSSVYLASIFAIAFAAAARRSLGCKMSARIRSSTGSADRASGPISPRYSTALV